MSKVKVAWQQADGGTLDQEIIVLVKELIRHEEINWNIIFDVHMNFKQKSMFVGRYQKAEAPNSITFQRGIP